MKTDKLLQLIYSRLFRSNISKSFFIISMISLVLSMINGTNKYLLFYEFIIYISLAMTTNCFIYGGCNISAFLILIVPVTLIKINILEFFGIKKEYKLSNIKKDIRKYRHENSTSISNAGYIPSTHRPIEDMTEQQYILSKLFI